MVSSVILLLVYNVQHFFIVGVHGFYFTVRSRVFAIFIKGASIATVVVLVIGDLGLNLVLWTSALRAPIVSIERPP